MRVGSFARGVRPGDRVLVQLPKRLEALVMQVAAFRVGAVDVPVVVIYRAHEMRQILADSAPPLSARPPGWASVAGHPGMATVRV